MRYNLTLCEVSLQVDGEVSGRRLDARVRREALSAERRQQTGGRRPAGQEGRQPVVDVDKVLCGREETDGAAMVGLVYNYI